MGCVTHPRKLDDPVTVSGLVIYPDKTPAQRANLTFSWSGFALPKGALRTLARIRSDEAGQFSHTFYEGPPNTIVVWSENNKFFAFVDLAEVRRGGDVVVTLQRDPLR